MLSPDQINTLNTAEVLDYRGQTVILGDILKDNRTLLIFIRHFWCPACRAYIRHLGQEIPPENLPDGTPIIIIGLGQPEPIVAYKTDTQCPYDIYTHPSLKIHSSLGFITSREIPAEVDRKAYDKENGGIWSRAVNAFSGVLYHPSHITKVGPSGMNGGEVLLDSDGTCTFFHQMKNTGDHTELDELARVIGARRTEKT